MYKRHIRKYFICSGGINDCFERKYKRGYCNLLYELRTHNLGLTYLILTNMLEFLIARLENNDYNTLNNLITNEWSKICVRPEDRKYCADLMCDFGKRMCQHLLKQFSPYSTTLKPSNKECDRNKIRISKVDPDLPTQFADWCRQDFYTTEKKFDHDHYSRRLELTHLIISNTIVFLLSKKDDPDYISFNTIMADALMGCPIDNQEDYEYYNKKVYDFGMELCDFLVDFFISDEIPKEYVYDPEWDDNWSDIEKEIYRQRHYHPE
jgi:hypothetical protein